MDRFRKRSSHSPLHQAEAYWSALRCGGDIPKRSQIDPRGLENILGQTFILERAAPGVARFRLAGQKVIDAAGMDVRGMPITAFFSPAHRKDAADAIERVFSMPAIARLTLLTEPTRLRGPREVVMLLMPLRSDLGEVTRILGAIAFEEETRNRTSQRFTLCEADIRPVEGYIADAGETAAEGDSANPGFAEAAERFMGEKTFMEEALARPSARKPGTAAPRRSAEAAQEDRPATVRTASHLRLVVDRE